MAEPDDLAGWTSPDWDHVLATWDALMPTDERASPTFAGRALTPQQGGRVFERLIMEAFRLSEAAGYHRFVVPISGGRRAREEIDGLVFSGWQGFLIEAKNEAGAQGIDPIFRLHLMAEQLPIGTMGLIFSASGFTEAAIELAEGLRPMRVLLFSKADLDWAIRARRDMMELIRRKWILALRSGRPYVTIEDFVEPFGGSDS